jgi:23S rRNA pseudouridine1911/1915/1917 synthase
MAACIQEESTREFRVAGNEAGQRLDVWLTGQMQELSRSRVQALISAGCVRLDGKDARAHARVAAGSRAVVRVPAVSAVEVEAQDIPLSVVFEDSHIVVVNKPAGMVVHPAPGHADNTLVNALLHHCGDLSGVGGESRPGIVHRLDRDTSGLMVVAKHDRAMAGLQQQFRRRLVRKEYLALVYGTPRPGSGRIETQIGRSRHDRKKMSVRPAKGRVAVTRYEVVETFHAAALVRALPETGRTHQIRVHMTHIGHPIMGDMQYGRRDRSAGSPVEVGRQMLHSQALAFTHPCEDRQLSFEAPLPADLQAVLAALRAAPDP